MFVRTVSGEVLADGIERAAMSGIRIVAILALIAITLSLEFWLGAPWYVSLPSGAISYLLTRYIGWAIYERRRLNREIGQMVEKARRGESLD